MTVPDEEVFAFVDGELPPEAMARIEAAMVTDPQLALRVETQRSLRRLLSGHPGGAARRAAPAPATPPAKPAEVIAFPSPQAKAKAAKVKAKPQDLRSSQPSKPSKPASEGGRPSWIAMTVCLVVGLAVGRFAAPSPPTLSGVDDTPPIATGPLAQALGGATTGQGAGPVRIALTFKDSKGFYCRAFQATGSASSAGVACREAGGWKVRMVGPAGPADPGAPAAVLAAAKTMIAGQPLDAASEAKARAGGWKPASR